MDVVTPSFLWCNAGKTIANPSVVHPSALLYAPLFQAWRFLGAATAVSGERHGDEFDQTGDAVG
jgi:hypothetical protein